MRLSLVNPLEILRTEALGGIVVAEDEVVGEIVRGSLQDEGCEAIGGSLHSFLPYDKAAALTFGSGKHDGHAPILIEFMGSDVHDEHEGIFLLSGREHRLAPVLLGSEAEAYLSCGTEVKFEHATLKRSKKLLCLQHKFRPRLFYRIIRPAGRFRRLLNLRKFLTRYKRNE